MDFDQHLHYSPHIPSKTTVSSVMLKVVLALVPGIITYVAFFGWGILVNIVIASITALGCEAIVMSLRNRPVVGTLLDGSALVTAILLALALPPHSAWWLVVVGSVFAIVIAKHLYGGLGYNPFNPAMAGYVVILISFPLEMTRWNPPLALADTPMNLFESFRYSLTGLLPERLDMDMISLATPLDVMRTQLDLGDNMATITAANGIFGHVAGTGGEWVSLAFLAGGLWLLYERIIDWRIPASLLAAILLMSGLFWMIDSSHYASPAFHLLAGATMLGAFFIATDPVSASTTPLGRVIFGAGCGVLIYVIRNWGGYPDGIAFSVLLMNMAAPLIDYYTQPRVIGQQRNRP
jgi:electron transport complex protein RnfD